MKRVLKHVLKHTCEHDEHDTREKGPQSAPKEGADGADARLRGTASSTPGQSGAGGHPLREMPDAAPPRIMGARSETLAGRSGAGAPGDSSATTAMGQRPPNNPGVQPDPGRRGDETNPGATVTGAALRRREQEKSAIRLGTGPLYQGRFKRFPIQKDAGCGTSKPWMTPREQLPVQAPAGWAASVDESVTQADLSALRRSATRGAPFGDPRWTARTAQRLSLQSSLRPRHRPKMVKTVRKDS